MKNFAFKKTMEMGWGDAIQRLNMLHAQITRGVASQMVRDEYKLILDALNQTKLDLGFDCNNDGVPDSIEIFAKSAKTSCCRIMPTKSSRRKMSSSRRKAG